MFTQNASSIATRGLPFGAISIGTCGMIYRVEISEVVPPTGGESKSGPKNLEKYKPRKSWVPIGVQPKIVTISVYAMGRIFTDTVMTDPNTTVTLDNIRIVEGEDGITIEVIGIELF